jgi:transcriptional regulator with XRE-family HTH domain
MNTKSDIKFSKPLFNDSNAILFDRTEYIKEYLGFVMKDIRECEDLSQSDLAERLGVKQPAVAKLEKTDRHHDIESVMKYLHVLGAELTVGVRYKDQFYQVSEPSSTVIVDVPKELCEEAQHCQMDVRSYVHEALGHYYTQGQGLVDQIFDIDFSSEEEFSEVI